MRSAANYLVDASDQADLLRMNEQLSLEGRYGTNVETARLKLSALAGFSDIESFATLEASAVYQQLFGDWHTTPNLPSSFWRDPAERQYPRIRERLQS